MCNCKYHNSPILPFYFISIWHLMYHKLIIILYLLTGVIRICFIIQHTKLQRICVNQGIMCYDLFPFILSVYIYDSYLGRTN